MERWGRRRLSEYEEVGLVGFSVCMCLKMHEVGQTKPI